MMTRLVTGPLGPMGMPGPAGHTGAAMISANSWIFRRPEDLKFDGYDDAIRVPDSTVLPGEEPVLSPLEKAQAEVITLTEQNKRLTARISSLEKKWWRPLHSAFCSVCETIDARFSRRGNPTQCIIPGSDNDNPLPTSSFWS